jgi:uncharacterized protein
VARLFVQIVTGPENPTRAALGLLIARAAVEEGHEVTLFLAGDAVDFIRPETAEAAHGVGLGSVAEHLGAIRGTGAPVHLSGMSSKARGIDASVVGEGVQMSRPQDVVALATAADTVLIY